MMKKFSMCCGGIVLGLFLTACNSNKNSNAVQETTTTQQPSTTTTTTTTQVPPENPNTVYNFFTKGKKVVYSMKGNGTTIEEIWDLEDGQITLYDGNGLSLKEIEDLTDKEVVQKVREMNKKLADDDIQKYFDSRREQAQIWTKQFNKYYDMKLDNETMSQYKASYRPTKSTVSVLATKEKGSTKLEKEYIMFVPNLKWNVPVEFEDKTDDTPLGSVLGYRQVGDAYYQLVHNKEKYFEGMKYGASSKYLNLQSQRLEFKPDETGQTGYYIIYPYNEAERQLSYRIGLPPQFRIIAQKDPGKSTLSEGLLITRGGRPLELDKPETEGVYLDDEIAKAQEKQQQEMNEILTSRTVYSGE